MTEPSAKLIDKLNSIPDLPGIYKMIDANGRIIYIGKSISLKNRTRSYFRGQDKRSKIEKMVMLIEDIEYEVTDTHLEARLKECRLIKELQPMFNAQFKNHKKYVYLKVLDYNIHNSLSVVYKKEDNCYGPFRSMSTLIETIDSLKNLYPIIKDDGRYNLEYNLLPIKMDIDTFNNNKDSLNKILSDENSLELIIEKLEDKMKEESEEYKFERATYFRDLISKLNYVKTTIFNYREIFNKHIVLKLDTQSGYKLFYVTMGEIIFKESY